MSTAATPLVDDAIGLLRRGLPIVICDGKVPLGGKDWHNKPVTERNLESLLQAATNPAIGLKLGPDSVVDIEADGPDEEALFTKLFENCEPPITPTYESTRGKHRLFKFDDRLSGTGRAVIHYRNGGAAKLGVRIGADGKAAQSVIPPSPGRKWLVSWDEAEPAELPDLVVKRILAAANPQAPQRPHHTHSPDIIDRARKYLMRIPPAISGQGGHDVTFHAACVLVQGFSLERGPALNLLREWNDLCQPPWAEWELEHKVDSAIADPGERGYLLNGAAGRARDTSGHDSAPRHTTDIGNGERFAEQHGGDCR